MKILHISTSIDQTVGGPARSIRSLLYGITEVGEKVEVNLLTSQSLNPVKIEVSEYLRVYCFKSLRILCQFLFKQRNDIYHIHGIWQSPISVSCAIALYLKVPYMISPRGMLEPWSLSQKSLKKRLALSIFQKYFLQKANCLHATSQSEADNFRKIGLTNPIAVVPNSLDLRKYFVSTKKRQNKILFLSRIHPKKGLEILIEAISLIEMSILQNWKVEIIGNGDLAYIKALNNLILEKQLTNIIQIKDPLFDKEKVIKYQEAKLFVLPSFSENFGVVIAESLACGTPVITTKNTPWKDLEIFECGWWIDNNVTTLKETLSKAMLMSDDDLMAMGTKGRNLVSEKFSSSVVAEKMLALYHWILNGEDKPDFVI